MRQALIVAVVGVWLVPAPAVAAEPPYTNPQLVELAEAVKLPNLAAIGPAPAITGNPTIDSRIRQLAEARGYRRRAQAIGNLAYADGYPVQPPVAEAWAQLKAAAASAGHSIRIISAFRSETQQVSTFLGGLAGYSDSQIDSRLRWSAPPGYSKHHTGYTIDITQAGSAFNTFGSTAAFRWISANGYENARRFGFLPSYPPGGPPQGPNPEPWEYVWVGVENTSCGWAILAIGPGGATIDDDLSTCHPQAVTRASLAYHLARALRLPAAGANSPFTDDNGSPYEPHIARLAAAGLASGCGTGAYCPRGAVTRAQLASLVARGLGLAPAGPSSFVDDNGHPEEPYITAVAAAGIMSGCGGSSFCPSRVVTRGELRIVIAATAKVFTPSPGRYFTDDDGNALEPFIEWAASKGITAGCAPLHRDLYCPAAAVTRGQMAAFLVAGLKLPPSPGPNRFVDDDGSPFEAKIEALAAAGITSGCDAAGTRFCPDASISRAEMAAMLVAAVQLPVGLTVSRFVDDDGSPFEAKIEALAAAGITAGCDQSGSRFCPDQPVTRAEMAVFLFRALQ
jgi:LAS superfamily LD-carboxypeptidase LdcB